MNIVIQGHYFPPKSSKRHDAKAEFVFSHHAQSNNISAEIIIDNNIRYDVKTIKISEPLGKMPRTIRFDDGAQFEFSDHNRFSLVEKQLNSVRKKGIKGLSMESWIKTIESKWQLIAISCLAMLGILFAVAKYGIPVGAKFAANKTPDYVKIKLEEQTIEMLDKYVFQPTLLDEDVQQKYKLAFDKIRSDKPVDLIFRYGDKIGANAIALPSRTVIVTDELIKLSESDDEVVAVLAHELAHIEYQHGLQRLYRDIGLIAILTVIIGDTGAVMEWVYALPAALVEFSFSREFEYEADERGVQILIDAGLPAERLGTMLLKLELAAKNRESIDLSEKSTENKEPVVVNKESDEQQEDESSIWEDFFEKVGIDKEDFDKINIEELGFDDYLSTHPATKKRILRIKELSEAAKNRK